MYQILFSLFIQFLFTFFRMLSLLLRFYQDIVHSEKSDKSDYHLKLLYWKDIFFLLLQKISPVEIKWRHHLRFPSRKISRDVAKTSNATSASGILEGKMHFAKMHGWYRTDSDKMLIKEYRIPLPLTVEEYRIAQLYMIAVIIRINISFALTRVFKQNSQFNQFMGSTYIYIFYKSSKIIRIMIW